LSKQEDIYKKAHGSFFKMCIRYCGDTETAKEVFNDAMLNYFRYEEKNIINEDGRFSLIKKIVTNKCIDHLRYKKARLSEMKLNATFSENEGQLNLMKDEMFEMIRSFPEQTRLIFNLYVFEGWSHKEIASELDISIHTSSWHVTQGKKQILELFKVSR